MTERFYKTHPKGNTITKWHYIPLTTTKILKSAIFSSLKNQPFSSERQLIDLQRSIRRFTEKITDERLRNNLATREQQKSVN